MLETRTTQLGYSCRAASAAAASDGITAAAAEAANKILIALRIMLITHLSLTIALWNRSATSIGTSALALNPRHKANAGPAPAVLEHITGQSGPRTKIIHQWRSFIKNVRLFRSRRIAIGPILAQFIQSMVKTLNSLL
jgi:type IV secretory pathway TrbF-like protein